MKSYKSLCILQLNHSEEINGFLVVNKLKDYTQIDHLQKQKTVERGELYGKLT